MTLPINPLTSLICTKLVNQRSSPSSQILHCELELKVKDTRVGPMQWDRENHYCGVEVRGCGRFVGSAGRHHGGQTSYFQ